MDNSGRIVFLHKKREMQAKKGRYIMITNNAKMLVTIVNRADGDQTEAMLKNYDFFLQFSCDAEGTQASDFLALLGLGTLEKTAVFCVAAREVIDKALADIGEALSLEKAGRGIAFTVPINNENTENEVDEMKNEHNLILAIVNTGKSAEVVSAAKDAGARGGTIIKAKHINSGDVVKFLGIAEQTKKEVVVIVTSSEQKQSIMDTIDESFGAQSSAQGVVLSVPVDGTAGMSF